MLPRAGAGARGAIIDAMSAAAELPPKPVAPDPGDCCGSGCARCVLDVYDEQLAAWRNAVAELERAAAAAAADAPSPLAPPGPTR
jgi:hypothetical protein